MDLAQSCGLLREDQMDWMGASRRDFLRRVAGIDAADNIRSAMADEYNIPADSIFIRCLDYLDLFSDKPMPVRKGAPLDIMVQLMESKLGYEEDERDMVALRHSFIVAYPDDSGENITSTLIDYGTPGGDSAMARTVGLPVAAAAKLILRGDIRKTGVHIPVTPDIYHPLLKEMEQEGISFKENIEKIT